MGGPVSGIFKGGTLTRGNDIRVTPGINLGRDMGGGAKAFSGRFPRFPRFRSVESPQIFLFLGGVFITGFRWLGYIWPEFTKLATGNR